MPYIQPVHCVDHSVNFPLGRLIKLLIVKRKSWWLSGEILQLCLEMIWMFPSRKRSLKTSDSNVHIWNRQWTRPLIELKSCWPDDWTGVMWCPLKHWQSVHSGVWSEAGSPGTRTLQCPITYNMSECLKEHWHSCSSSCRILQDTHMVIEGSTHTARRFTFILVQKKKYSPNRESKYLLKTCRWFNLRLIFQGGALVAAVEAVDTNQKEGRCDRSWVHCMCGGIGWTDAGTQLGQEGCLWSPRRSRGSILQPTGIKENNRT